MTARPQMYLSARLGRVRYDLDYTDNWYQHLQESVLAVGTFFRSPLQDRRYFPLRCRSVMRVGTGISLHPNASGLPLDISIRSTLSIYQPRLLDANSPFVLMHAGSRLMYRTLSEGRMAELAAVHSCRTIKPVVHAFHFTPPLVSADGIYTQTERVSWKFFAPVPLLAESKQPFSLLLMFNLNWQPDAGRCWLEVLHPYPHLTRPGKMPDPVRRMADLIVGKGQAWDLNVSLVESADLVVDLPAHCFPLHTPTREQGYLLGLVTDFLHWLMQRRWPIVRGNVIIQNPAELIAYRYLICWGLALRGRTHHEDYLEELKDTDADALLLRAMERFKLSAPSLKFLSNQDTLTHAAAFFGSLLRAWAMSRARTLADYIGVMAAAHYILSFGMGYLKILQQQYPSVLEEALDLTDRMAEGIAISEAMQISEPMPEDRLMLDL